MHVAKDMVHRLRLAQGVRELVAPGVIIGAGSLVKDAIRRAMGFQIRF